MKVDRSTMSQGEVDAHGHVDILNEKNFSGKKWSDVSVVNIKKANEITGCTLNSLLRGLFIIYGKENLNENDLPGGIHCWEKLVEPMYISLTSIATVDEVFTRLNYLIHSLYVNHKMVGSEAHGGLSFVYYWVLCFNIYISDINLYRINDGVLRLGYIIEDSSVSSTIETHADIATHLTACHKRYKELVSVVDSVLRSRCHHGSLDAKGQFAYVSEPNLSLIKGIWSGHDIQLKKEKLKESLAKAPKLKLEIFGGDTLMDSSDDDDKDSAHGSKDGPTVDPAAASAAVVVVAPPPKIPLGYSLLQDPSVIAKDLLAVDLQELARQWTLLDHAAFCALPLHSLIGSTVSAARHALPRYKQVRSGSGYCGSHFTTRRFIDRFNATSTWVQYMVMSGTNVVDRAAIITKLIRLAGHLSDLCNFSTMFAIVSGLSQACVRRMEVSFGSVSKADRAVFARLTNLMSGSKNQQKYRDEVTRITHIILSSNDHHLKNGAATTTASGITGSSVAAGVVSTNTTAAGVATTNESSIEWRKYIYSKLQTPRTQTTEEAWNEFQMNVAASDFKAEDHPSLTNDTLEAIVPHLGAHVSEIAAIGEGNANYLSESSHLYNVEKFRLISSSLATLNKIQKMKYHLTPLRTIQAAINVTIKRHMRLGANEANEYSKQLFTISELRETPEEVEQYVKDTKGEEPVSTISAANALIQQNNANKDKDGKVSFADATEGTPGEERGRSRIPKKQKYIRSDAYDSIVSGTTATRPASPSPSARRRAASQVTSKQNNVAGNSSVLQRSDESDGHNADDDQSTNESDDSEDVEDTSESDDPNDEDNRNRRSGGQSALSPMRMLKSARSIFRGVSFRN